MAKRRRSVIALSAGIVLCVNVSASSATPAASGAALPASQSRASVQSALVPVNRMTFKIRGQSGDVRADNGFRATMQVVVYRVSHLANAPALPFNHLRPHACDSNQFGLGIVPVSVTITNTTPSFAVPVRISPYAGANLQNHGFDYLLIKTDAGGCFPTQSDPPQFSWPGIAPGQHGTVAFYIEIVGYYSPTHPNGDSAALADTCIDFNPIIGGTGATFPVISPKYRSPSLARQGSCVG